jgi:hypothetical protein
MPKAAEPGSLTSLREKLIKIGAKVVSHGRYVTFQMAEVAVSRQMFDEILSLIAGGGRRPRQHDGGCGQMRRPTVQGAARRIHSNKFRQHESPTGRFGGSAEHPCGAQ